MTVFLERAWNWLRQRPFWTALTVILLSALTGLFADDLLAHFDQFSGAYSALAALATTGATFVIAAFSYGTYRLFRIEQARVDALRAEIDMKVRVVHTQVGSFLEVLDDEDEFEGTFDTINPWFSRWNTIAKAKALDSAVGKWMIERLQSVEDAAKRVGPTVYRQLQESSQALLIALREAESLPASPEGLIDADGIATEEFGECERKAAGVRDKLAEAENKLSNILQRLEEALSGSR